MFPFRTSADCPGSPPSCQPAVLIQASSFLDRQTQDILKLQFSEKGLKALNTLRRRLSGRRLRHNGDGLQTGSGDKISGRHHRLRPTCTEPTAPAPSAGGPRSPEEGGPSRADLSRYSISRSTGPDDSFFHISGRSHKYSNLVAAQLGWVEWGGRCRTVGEEAGGGGGVSQAQRELSQRPSVRPSVPRHFSSGPAVNICISPQNIQKESGHWMSWMFTL